VPKLLEMGEPSELDLLRRRVEELEDELRIERLKVEEVRQRSVASGRALARLRSYLQPWHMALKEVFGELDGAGIEEGTSTPVMTSISQPVSAAAYDAWKARLTPSCGRVIDALLVQPLNLTQMSTICKMNYYTARNSIVLMQKNGLIEREGNSFRLKRL